MSASASSAPQVTLPDIPEYTAVERMYMEKETTGLYLSGHPMDDYRKAAERVGAVSIGGVNEDFAREDGPQRYQDGQRVTLAGVVTSSKTKTTRNNSLMAYVTLEDDTGSMELLCFSRTLESCGSYLQENQAVVVRGKLSVRDEKAPQLMCDSAWPLTGDLTNLPERKQESQGAEGKVLYLRLDSVQSKEFRHLQLVLQMFPGNTPVKIRIVDTGKLLGTTCLLHDSLLREVRERLGEENVVVK